MAIAFDAASSADINASGTSLTFDITTATDGAWVYALLAVAANQTGVTWTGWTQVVEGDEANTSHYALFRRQKQSGDTTFSVTWPTAQKATVCWSSYTGLDPTTPDELAAAATAALATQTTPTLTPTAADRWAFCGYFNRSTTAGSNVVWSSYTTSGGGTQTERVQHVNGSSRYEGVALTDTAAAPPQVAQSYSATSSPGGNHGGATLLFLVPAAAGGAVALDGKAVAAASAGGSMAASRPLAATGPVAASATATTAIARPLAGGAPAAAGATADLTVHGQVALQGIAVAADSATATAAVARPLAGGTPAAGSASGRLGTTCWLAGATATAAQASGRLAASRPLAASVSVAAGATGTLATTSVPIPSWIERDAGGSLSADWGNGGIATVDQAGGGRALVAAAAGATGIGERVVGGSRIVEGSGGL